MKQHKGMSKRRKIILITILALLLAAVATILIINSTYRYDPTGSGELLGAGEKGILTLQYNGADGKPESEEISYSKAETMSLPDVSKPGYFFTGWVMGDLYVGNEITLYAKQTNLQARFTKDYTDITSACAVFTDEVSFTEYKKGAYAKVNTEAVDVYLDGGYKLTVYSKENFAGEQTKVYYSGMFSGFIGSMKIEPVESEAIEIGTLSDAQKVNLLSTFAPRIWWDENERFFASSVDFAAEHMEKTLSAYANLYYLKALDSPDYMSDFFYGDLAHAKVYAFATEKEFKYLDLSYFYYAPFNQGKQIAGMEFGDHVGDWEHISVRLLKEKKGDKLYCRPVTVDYSAHFMRNYVAWDEVQTVGGTHPVAYTACGSHGMWKDSGTHVYVNAVIVKLKDYCSQGIAWDVWEPGNMETYAYDALTHQGRGIGESKWNPDFDTDCWVTGGGVSIWGNKGWRPPIQIYPRMDSAPSGPQHKQSLNNYYTINGKSER